MTRTPNIAAALISAIISGCLVGPTQAADDTTIHTVGIVSTCGHFFTLQHVGTLRFDNTVDQAPVDEWGMDDMIAASVSQALGDHYVTKAISVAPQAITLAPGSLFSSHPDPNQLRISLQDSGTFDAYVLVWPATRADTIEGTDTKLTGIGLYQRTLLGDYKMPDVFTACRLSFVDGRTFATISQEMLSMPRDSDNGVGNFLLTVSTLESGNYYTMTNAEAWADTVDALTPQKKKMILGSLSKLLDQEIPATLRKLKIIP